ncbi:phage minor head protein [Tabrizicola fusiformis]|uniref:phage minor head protein n=1 Tax=Tabrizicola sp. SY72 TaxID=2741673 RepID=UPI00157196C5|nr:phage head protein [Tabrizicola sp. SY72]
MKPAVLATFRQPFRFQVAAWRLRLNQLQPTRDWQDVWQAQHDRAFMVAGAMRADILADLAAAVDRAIVQGGTIEDFRRDFRAIVAAKGWQISTAGQGTEKGEAWRTRVIYKTNLATSYAAGRWAQLREAGYPYLVYRHGGSLEPRPQHLAWDGLVLEADHAFWATHAPPNGWGCSCYINGARSLDASRRLGGKPGKVLPQGWERHDPKTGAPVGIDKGWAYGPGSSVMQEVSGLAAAPARWPYGIAKAYMESVPIGIRDDFARAYRAAPSTADAVQRFVDAVPKTGSIDDAVQMITLGQLTSADAERIFSLTGETVTGFDFALDATGVRHAFNQHGNSQSEELRGQRAITAADFASVPLTLNVADPAGISYVGLNNNIHLISWRRDIGGEAVTVLFELRKKRRRLSLLTMWVKAATGRPPPLSP